MIRFVFFFSITMLFTTLCFGQQRIVLPPDFIETIPPEVHSDEWVRLNHSSGNAFRVKVDDNELLDIRRIRERRASVLEISNGTLYGFIAGRGGGLLIYIPSSDPNKRIEMPFYNVLSIFQYNNHICILVAVGFWNATGAMLRLNIGEDNTLEYEKVIEFDGVPSAYTIYNDKLLIVAGNSIYRINDFQKERIFEYTFWDGLAPNSIAVIDEQNVFVGMRGGVARVNLEKQTMTFYKNDASMGITKQDYDAIAKAEFARNIAFSNVNARNLTGGARPEFPGGRQAMLEWIRRNIRIPLAVEKKGIRGEIVCRFIIERDGSIHEVEILTSLNPYIDKEVVRVIENMPRWNPGVRFMQPLRVYYDISISIEIDDEKQMTIKID